MPANDIASLHYPARFVNIHFGDAARAISNFAPKFADGLCAEFVAVLVNVETILIIHSSLALLSHAPLRAIRSQITFYSLNLTSINQIVNINLVNTTIFYPIETSYFQKFSCVFTRS